MRGKGIRGTNQLPSASLALGYRRRFRFGRVAPSVPSVHDGASSPSPSDEDDDFIHVWLSAKESSSSEVVLLWATSKHRSKRWQGLRWLCDMDVTSNVLDSNRSNGPGTVGNCRLGWAARIYCHTRTYPWQLLRVRCTHVLYINATDDIPMTTMRWSDSDVGGHRTDECEVQKYIFVFEIVDKVC